MKTYYTVYKITNVINDEYYIGKHQTQNLEDGYMGSGKLLQKQFQEYGMQWFEKDILHVFDTEEEMNQMEAELVDADDPKSLNLCPGGHGGFGYINNHEKSSDWKSKGAKNRIAKHGNPRTEAGKQKFVAAVKRLHAKGAFKYDNFKGKKHTEEAKAKISAADRTGKKNSQYGTMWITDGVNSRKIKCYDEIPDGWERGRRIKA